MNCHLHSEASWVDGCQPNKHKCMQLLGCPVFHSTWSQLKTPQSHSEAAVGVGPDAPADKPSHHIPLWLLIQQGTSSSRFTPLGVVSRDRWEREWRTTKYLSANLARPTSSHFGPGLLPSLLRDPYGDSPPQRLEESEKPLSSVSQGRKGVWPQHLKTQC